MTREEQIAHIEYIEYTQPDEPWVKSLAGRTVREYFDEYCYIEDLYERVCSDLNIESLKE